MTIVRRLLLSLIVTAPLIAPPVASACGIDMRAMKRFPKAVAASGYLVKARVVRGYDAVKRLPEQLEIEQVFVGEPLPRSITIHRSKEFYDDYAPPPPGVIVLRSTCPSIEYAAASPGAELMILFPALSETGALIPGAYRFDYMRSLLHPGRELDAMLDKAKRKGRLRARPLPTDF